MASEYVLLVLGIVSSAAGIAASCAELTLTVLLPALSRLSDRKRRQREDERLLLISV
ncbi:hypothetical pox protein [Squirrelpox virus]|uniref:A9L n=1 Tax=Squirrelpox virus TaxID=240426 RepID=Q1HTT5_9POXV|nr:hypothetical pox protein [Squirrelpox virus]ABD51451.1 A9L [Squirrelpox virus]CCD83200.1 hypothetical pox protein [Squirrelpox virus]